MTSPLYCPGCGEPVSAASVECVLCGADLGAHGAQARPTVEPIADLLIRRPSRPARLAWRLAHRGWGSR